MTLLSTEIKCKYRVTKNQRTHGKAVLLFIVSLDWHHLLTKQNKMFCLSFHHACWGQKYVTIASMSTYFMPQKYVGMLLSPATCIYINVILLNVDLNKSHVNMTTCILT